jgi:hypothetical protein
MTCPRRCWCRDWTRETDWTGCNWSACSCPKRPSARPHCCSRPPSALYAWTKCRPWGRHRWNDCHGDCLASPHDHLQHVLYTLYHVPVGQLSSHTEPEKNR